MTLDPRHTAFKIFKIPHTGIACESMEKISHKKSTHTGAKSRKRC